MTLRNKNLPASQRGFATILIVLLVGLTIAASALGTAYYINTSQRTLVTSHALTNAQSGAWTGVEVFRKYLDQYVGKVKNKSEVEVETEVNKLKGETFTLNVIDGRTLNVRNVDVEVLSTTPKTYRVSANIQNLSSKSESSATIQVTYLISLGKGNNSTNNNTSVNAIDIYGDLKVAGGIEIKGGKNAVVNVHGNFESTGNTFIGVNELNVTGNVTLNGGGERIGTIVSNGDVYLGPGSEVDVVYAKGKITVNTGKQVGEMYADKDIIITNGSVKVANTLSNINLSGGGTGTILIAGGDITVNNGSVGNADAQGTISFTGNSANTLTAGKKITVNNGSVGTVKAKDEIVTNGGNITNAFAKGNITVNSNSVTLSRSTTEKTFICNADWWNKLEYINAKKIQYSQQNCAKESSNAINVSSTPTVNFSSEEPKRPSGSTKAVIVTDEILVNVLDNLADANYIFYIDSNQRIKVKVQNVKDQTTNVDYSGDYYLAKIKLGGNQYWAGNPYTGYLCKKLDSTDPEFCENTPNIGQLKNYIYQLKLFPNEPNTTNGQFVSYQSSDRTWILADTSYYGTHSSIAPDVPSLAPGVMFFYGNLRVGQGAYNNSMLATGNIEASIPSVYSPNYAGANKICNVSGYKMPSNLCKSSSELTSATIGDIALMAGSCTNGNSLQACKASYNGGNINLTSNSYIFGKVIAGSRFNTAGASQISGQITAANLGASQSNFSSFNSSVVIDLTNVKNDSGNNTDDNNTTGSDGNFTKIKWARYL
ncbi:hypothetical protein [Acinetobacter sp. ANC 4173]|uniref:hypothetical protein n=1 Tax=Acinetobacter sp. ANC 4173 TaxID=2529837 RepID=UPI00103CACBE|nr:hypothetical protein [Acinetobacter sp. ANC 4173]TCB79536.1 hypothetical protein E0H94_10035 [Acinetobacter sp. ANC 4173]